MVGNRKFHFSYFIQHIKGENTIIQKKVQVYMDVCQDTVIISNKNSQWHRNEHKLLNHDKDAFLKKYEKYLIKDAAIIEEKKHYHYYYSILFSTLKLMK